MTNKYLYAFLKDTALRVLCILSVIGIILFLALIPLNGWQEIGLKDIQYKQAIIAQIPSLQATIAKLRKEPVNDLFLTGIVTNEAQSIAIINNTLLKVGDEIEDKKVTLITGNSATVCDTKVADKCFTLLLEQ